MAGGINPLGNTPGKVDSNNNLLVAIGAGSVLPNGTAIDAGTGTADATLGGTLTVSTTQTGTTAVTTEEDLWTYSLPANTLSSNGKTVRITGWISTAANANTKTVRVYFGSTVIATRNTATASLLMWFEAYVVRTSATAQIGRARRDVEQGALNYSFTTPAETLTGAVTIKITGQNGTASANDIVLAGAVVELLN
jgi:hypothetical protein